ncbi:MAG: NAD-dependent epimerase/dehydratase family protein [Nitrospiraceae bacterium]|nr:NAD-dependent epimerase/dehydratase family protein [Nitrospiraceae bacterium]
MGFWQGRTVLVTGGNGFIGSHLVEMLVHEGAVVTSTASSEATRWRYLEAVRSDVRTVVGDLADVETARRAVNGQQIVMHLAARVGGIQYNMDHPASIFRGNMTAFLSVIEAARLERVERFLVTSSACVYPRHCTVPTPEAEGFRDRPEPTNEGYGWAKRMEEFVGAAYADEHGLCVRVARPFNAYGPRDNFDQASSHVIPALIRRVEAGENPLSVWGDGSATRSFLYVTDFARGLMAVAEHASDPAPINIGSDEEVSMAELAHMVVEESGRNMSIRFDASKPAGQPRRACDTTKASRLLGFRAEVPLRQGLRRTFEWYRACQPAKAA